jgi:hypothetical protein
MYYATRDKNIIEAGKENPIIQSLGLRTLKSNKPKLLSINDPKIKFEKYKKDQNEKISNEENKQKDSLNSEQEKTSKEIDSLESNLHNNRKETDLAQLSDWHKNMKIKKSFELRLHNELFSEANSFKKFVFESINNSQKEEKTQIENFEKNLSRLGLDTSNQEQKQKKSNKSAVSGEIVLQKIREKILANAVAKKERDRRKRKILIEHKKAQEELLNNEKKSALITNEGANSSIGIMDKLAKEAAEAKFFEFNAWKELHNINCEVEMQKQKETENFEKERHKNYEDNFVEFFAEREKLNKFNKQEFINQVYSEDRTQKQKEMDSRLAKRAKNLIPIKKITEQILEITEEVFKFQTEFNVELLDQSYWKDLMKCFENNTALSERCDAECAKSAVEVYFDAPNIDKTSENADNVSRSKFIESQQDISFYNVVVNNVNINLVNSNIGGQVIEGVFEECELFDYVNFIGQYKTLNVIPVNILNKMLDMFEIMGNDIALLVEMGSKYGKIADAYKEYEPTDCDIENLTIPAVYVKNYNLNDIINILIDIKFSNANNNSFNGFNNQAIAAQDNLIGINNNNNNNLLGINNLNVSNNILNITSNSGTFNLNNNIINYNTNNNLAVNTIHISNLNSIHSNSENINKTNNNNNINKPNSALTNTDNSKLNPLIQNIFTNIPLKILFLGKKFSGRKTQIKTLSENFPLKFYNVEELITKNISLLEELEIPFEENPKFKNLKKNELEKAMADRALEEAKFVALKLFAKPLKEYRDKAQKIPDNVLFEFLFEVIKADFPEKSQSQLLEELNQKHKKKKELMEELAKIKEEKNTKSVAVAKNPSGKNETFYINELQKLNIETNKGLVLLDFPGSLEQAKFFEHKINNYVCEKQKPKNLISQLKENYGVILDKIPKPNQNRTLSQGAFDIVFYLEAAEEETIRRAKNRKIDPNTGIVYHLEDNPPPAEDKKLNERLIPFEENLIFETLLDNNSKFDKEADALVEFFEAFGFQKANFKSLYKFPFGASNHSENLNTASNLNNKNLLTDRSEKTGMSKEAHNLNPTTNNNINTKKDLKEQLLSTNAEMKEIVLHMLKINEEREIEILALATLNSKNNNNINTNNLNFCGKEPVTNSTNTHLNLIATINNNNNQSRRNSNANQNINLTKDFQKSKEQMSNNINNNNNNHATQSHLSLNTEAENATNNFHSKKNFILPPKNNQIHNNIQNLDEEDFNKYHKKLEEAKRKLAGFTVESIFTQWTKMHENYICGVKIFFKNLRKQKENIILTFNRMQEKFVEFLRRPSLKMVVINKFQKKYNKFFDEYPQLRGDGQVKAEFHQDVSDLSDRIWEVIEERKSEAIAERRKIMESGHVEKEMEKFYDNLENLFSLEVDKFVTNVNTIRDFYCSMDLKYTNTHESLGFSPQEVLKDAELFGLPIYVDSLNCTGISAVKAGKDKAKDLGGSRRIKNSVENSNKKFDYNNKDNGENDNDKSDYKYPRVQKLFKNSIKLILKLDDNIKGMEKISKSNALNNLSSESSIRKMSRIHPRRIQETTFVDDKREIFIYEEDLKNSLKFEKSKFKYRVTFLKYWAVEYFENLRKISKLVYDKLDDWIISTIKAENDAMNNLVMIFDGCIEKEMRLRIDFEMDSFEIYKFININDKIDILVILEIKKINFKFLIFL